MPFIKGRNDYNFLKRYKVKFYISVKIILSGSMVAVSQFVDYSSAIKQTFVQLDTERFTSCEVSVIKQERVFIEGYFFLKVRYIFLWEYLTCWLNVYDMFSFLNISFYILFSSKLQWSLEYTVNVSGTLLRVIDVPDLSVEANFNILKQKFVDMNIVAVKGGQLRLLGVSGAAATRIEQSFSVDFSSMIQVQH